MISVQTVTSDSQENRFFIAVSPTKACR